LILDRESIRDGLLEKLGREAGDLGLFEPLTDEDRAEIMETLLTERKPGEGVWIFGYGSLIWNPAFHFVEQRMVRVHGYHRAYCLWTPLGRGTPEHPGLMLGLENGGSVTGVAFRIDEALVREEMMIIFKRELLSGAYRARWVNAQSDEGPVRTVAFVINHTHPRYAGKLEDDLIARTIATACGKIGSCREYLENTVAKLDELGIPDRNMHDLLQRVRAVA
jgi:cation transport protein ChaC